MLMKAVYKVRCYNSIDFTTFTYLQMTSLYQGSGISIQNDE